MVLNGYTLTVLVRERHTADRRAAQQLRDVRETQRPAPRVRVAAARAQGHVHWMGRGAAWLRELAHWWRPDAPAARGRKEHHDVSS
jgi:hypothetical protein